MIIVQRNKVQWTMVRRNMHNSIFHLFSNGFHTYLDLNSSKKSYKSRKKQKLLKKKKKTLNETKMVDVSIALKYFKLCACYTTKTKYQMSICKNIIFCSLLTSHRQ